MSAVSEIRPNVTEAFTCPCGSQWFTRKFQFDSKGVQIAKEDQFECAGGCGRKHLPTPSRIAAVQTLRKKP